MADSDTHTELKNPESLEDLVSRLGEVSTLPDVAMKVMDIANDPKTSSPDLTRVVQSDPPLSAKVLKTANSAAYGVRQEITSLQHAVTYLGFNQIRNLALTLAVSKVFRPNEKLGSYQRESLWRHSVSVAIGARYIADRVRIPDYEQAFASGLLHDLGIILEDQYIHGHFADMITGMKEGTSLVDIEQEYLGFDHTQIGHRLANRWKFPEVVKASIRHHHAAHEYKGDSLKIVMSVEVSNILCSYMGITSIGLNLIKPHIEAITGLGLEKKDLPDLAEELEKEIERNKPLFELL